MSYTLADARNLAMNLGLQDRFALAHELFDSLEPLDDVMDIKEIDRRLAEIRSGAAETVSLDELEKSMQEALDASVSPRLLAESLVKQLKVAKLHDPD